MSTLVGCLCAAILLIVLLRLLMLLNFRSPKEDSLRPSGPSGYPLIGHLNFPSHPPWKTIAQWSKTYHSDIIAYKLFGNDIIFLNSFEAATDLLDKRSAIYSDRHVANLVMLRELCGLEWTFAFQRYGREWRDGRKAFQQEYSAEAIKQYRPSALKATSKFLRRLLSTPDDFMIHVRDLSGERILSTAYGIETKGRGDPWVATSEQVTIAVSATLELGRYWVDFMPILRYVPEWMPGAGFKRQARLWRRAMTDMLHKPFDYVKRRLEDGEAVPDCAAKSLIERNINNTKDPVYWEKIVKGALGSMYGAGTDTTAGTLMSFFLAMAQYPEVQRKAQESIDLVCSGRLPNYSDRERLPYIEAILKECLRWNPVAVFSLNHRCMQDDVYRGYHFSEGTVFIANIWAILHDADTYPDPERFHPERFLTADERKINIDILDPVNVVFGFGRRICPGLQMACETLWLVMVSVLATLEISDAIDDKGIPVPRGAENREGFVSMPKPFSCRIQARTAAHEELLEGAL